MRSVTQARSTRALPCVRVRLSRARWTCSTVRSSVRICFCVIASVATTTSGRRIALSALSRSLQRIVHITSRARPAAATTRGVSVAAAGFALLVMWTMRWSDLLKALSAMRLPDVVVATLAMTQKQILTLLRTVEQVHLARESRTLTRGSARADRAWVTERMAFVVRKSMKTADDVYDAMLSRGFTGAMPSLVKLRLRPRG